MLRRAVTFGWFSRTLPSSGLLSNLACPVTSFRRASSVANSARAFHRSRIRSTPFEREQLRPTFLQLPVVPRLVSTLYPSNQGMHRSRHLLPVHDQERDNTVRPAPDF